MGDKNPKTWQCDIYACPFFGIEISGWCDRSEKSIIFLLYFIWLYNGKIDMVKIYHWPFALSGWCKKKIYKMSHYYFYQYLKRYCGCLTWIKLLNVVNKLFSATSYHTKQAKKTYLASSETKVEEYFFKFLMSHYQNCCPEKRYKITFYIITFSFLSGFQVWDMQKFWNNIGDFWNSQTLFILLKWACYT